MCNERRVTKTFNGLYQLLYRQNELPAGRVKRQEAKRTNVRQAHLAECHTYGGLAPVAFLPLQEKAVTKHKWYYYFNMVMPIRNGAQSFSTHFFLAIRETY